MTETKRLIPDANQTESLAHAAHCSAPHPWLSFQRPSTADAAPQPSPGANRCPEANQTKNITRTAMNKV